MSHLIQEYAKSCGVKIGSPKISPTFYPIPFDKYITIHHGTCNSTVYSYWPEVIEILKPILEKENIKIVQILEGKSPIIPKADHHVLCSPKQAAHIVEHSECHVGVDSVYCSIAGEFLRPLVAVYSHTSPKNTGPWKCDKEKTNIITAFGDAKPSYNPNDSQKVINSIKPEYLAGKILSSLNKDDEIKFKTLFIGERFRDECIDVVPIAPTNIQREKINVRMDIHHDESVLAKIIEKNRVEVTLSNPISSKILFSGRIFTINYLSEKFDESFVKMAKQSGIQLNLLCVSKKDLSNERAKFFDYSIIFHDLKEIIAKNKEKFSEISTENLKIKSNKQIVIGEKTFHSYREALQCDDLFFLDLEWLYVYSD